MDNFVSGKSASQKGGIGGKAGDTCCSYGTDGNIIFILVYKFSRHIFTDGSDSSFNNIVIMIQKERGLGDTIALSSQEPN